MHYKKYQTPTNNPPIKMHSNNIENRIIFQTTTGYNFELLTPETMKLLGHTKIRNLKIKITKVILVDCSNVNNDYQQNSRVLYTFVLNKSFGQLLKISPTDFIFLGKFNSEFSYIEL